jgi:hypothetical protein
MGLKNRKWPGTKFIWTLGVAFDLLSYKLIFWRIQETSEKASLLILLRRKTGERWGRRSQ